MSERRPVAGIGVVCIRGDEVLLIRRGKPPRLDEWSLPGGRLEWGETAHAGALRELKEETGVEAEIVGLVDVVDFIAEDTHYVLVDYAARWVAGEPVAGDDARDARFFPLREVPSLRLWSQTERVIRDAAAIVCA
ncbi:MAG: NUDIX hydrolase [Hyphomonadaceae bacterium]|nr:NUDIX hydrolase [Hyphomonadaceae bacterium]